MATAKGYPLVPRSAMKPKRRHSRAGVPALLLALALVPLAALGTAEGSLTVVCLGDSLTEGYGVAPEHSYPSLLQAHFDDAGADVRVVNAGVSGATSASAVSRLRWQLSGGAGHRAARAGRQRRSAGRLSRRHASQPGQSAIELAKQAGVTVVLAGMKLPPNYGPGYLRDFERVFPELAERNGLPFIPFLLEGVAAEPDLNLPDGIHPNAAGYRIVVKTVLETLAPLVTERKS